MRGRPRGRASRKASPPASVDIKFRLENGYGMPMPQYMGIDHHSWERKCPACGGAVDWWYAGGYRTGPTKGIAVFVPECLGQCAEGTDIKLSPKYHTVSRQWTAQEAGRLPKPE